MPDHALLAALAQHFGFSEFRPGQLEAMRPVMQGRDSLVVMPTGAGKSLCYQLPALLQEGTTLVISPLIALMKDQVDSLQANGVAATFINSSLDGGEQGARLDALRRGQWRLCYVAPERLKNQAFRAALQQARVAFLAVDEAHCISQWGHDFRPDYRTIGELVEEIGRPPIVALTATATPQVQSDIESQLRLRDPYRLVTGFNRPNLRFDLHFCPGDTAKQQVLKTFLDQQPADSSGVIYVGRRREAEEVADFVQALCGRRTVYYHGGLDGAARSYVQEDWMRGRAPIVVATNAFGMGVDKADVRFVVHYTMPGTLEAYYQEAGRAGRDGGAAHCLLLLDPADSRLHEWFIENDAPTLEELRELYGEVRAQARRNGGTLGTTESMLATVLGWRGDGKVRVGLKMLGEVELIEELGEQNGLGWWRLLPVPERVDMNGPLRDVSRRRALKRRMLQTMLDYAQTHECRRQYLLDYFGDPTPPVADWCCDNCQRQEQPLDVATSPETRAPLWVLDAVRHLPHGLGRSRLAKLLSGSRAKGMERYYEHPQYGILRHLGHSDVQKLVDELIHERYLRIEAGPYPTLSLTPSGEQAAERRLAIPVSVGIHSAPQPSAHSVPAQRVTDTMGETRRLFEQGHSPDEIGTLRGLTISTIYNHLASLIESGELPIEQVVPDETRTLIERAVREVGSFYLSPIKARLPEEISFGEIRCVVAALRRHGGDAAASAGPQDNQRRELLLRLTDWRREVAREANQPPFFICSNAVLAAIAEAMPRHAEALAEVPGIGPAKLDSFGDAILALVAEVAGEAPPPASPPPAEAPPSAPDPVDLARTVPAQGFDEWEAESFARLRHWRSVVAKQAGIPAYIVFPNATLQAIAEQQPRTLDALRAIPGIGPTKLDSYGAAILALLNG